MISFFRRALSSWLVLALFGLVIIAFAVTSIDPSWVSGTGQSGSALATVGSEKLTPGEARRRLDNALNAARQQNPGLDMASFAKAGGVDQVIAQYVSGKAMEVWARKQGLTASERLIDGEIASISAFYGPTGKFDRTVMEGFLRQNRITERQLREDITGDAIRRQMLIPVAGAAKASEGMASTYAALLLEQRSGQVGVVPSAAIPAGAAPTEAEIAAFHKANIARFTIPERRVLRYAIFGSEGIAATAPTQAEIDAFYKANAATYGASETRAIQQVILQDEKAAAALAARARSGDFAAAARAAGGEAVAREVNRARLTSDASAAVANAAFALPQGGVSAPVKADLGWYVVKVTAIRASAGRPLAAVREEIAQAITKQKRDEALNDMVSSIEDAIADGSSFDDVVRSEKLTVATTPAVLPNGRAPGQPGWQAPPELPLLMRSAVQMSSEDDPTVETIGAGQRYALLAVSQVVPPTPAPIAEVRDAIIAGIRNERTAKQARAIADAVLAKVKAGTPLATALAQAPVRLPAPAPARARQMDLARSDRPAPPPLVAMFEMRKGEARLIAAPNNAGWFVVRLDEVVPGDARTQPGLIASTRNEFASLIGEEYVQQFANAVAGVVGVKRNQGAIEALKAELSGSR